MATDDQSGPVPGSGSAQPTLLQGTVQLSSLGFGCAPIGNLYETVSDDDADGAIEEAFTQGIRHFDAAPFYGFGLGEARLGHALAGRPRSSFAISTKVGRRIESGTQKLPQSEFAVLGRHAVFDYSRDGVRRSIEASLRRLAIDHIDILLLHDVGSLAHGERHSEVLKQSLDEALPAMAALKEAGVVDAIGIGVNEQAVCLDIMPNFNLDCIMLAGRYTLLEQHESVEVLSEAQRRGVKIIVAGPYNSGLLADAARPGETYNYQPVQSSVRDRARRIYSLCAQEGVDVGAAALQFPLAHPAVANVVAGLRTRQEVLTAARRLRDRIPMRLWGQLQEAGLLAADAVVPKK